MTLHSCFQSASLTPHPAPLQVVTGSAKGRGDGRNSGAAAEAPGMQMVSVTTTRGGDDALRRVVPSAPLRRGDEEPVEVDDAPPEAEPRPLPIARLFGGGGSNASAPPVLKRRE